MRHFLYSVPALLLILLLATQAALAAPAFPDVPASSAALASIDLGSDEGLASVKGEWRYSDTTIVEVTFRAPGKDGQPDGGKVRTYDFTPHAGGADFDDSKWQVIPPATLSQRRGNGRLSFNWYRLRLTVPEDVNGASTRGTTLVFETKLDDYAEIWVDGELPRAQAQSGGSVVKGWNAPNRLIVARNVAPGQVIQLAVFGMNGPISAPPTNFIYMHYARLELHKGDGRGAIALPPHEVNVEVIRKDPRIDAIVPSNPKVFKLAEGFQFTEGPVWIKDDSPASGHLLFSDPNANLIYKYTPDSALTVFRRNAGYAGKDIAEYRQPGSNGLTLDPQGRLTINQHGNRRIVRVDGNGKETVLVSSDGGRRLNSPNDLVYKSDGTLYFTDPFFGLPKFGEDPRKKLPYQAVYRVVNGQAEALVTNLKGPNGIAFSPDEKYLYVGDWDDAHKAVMRYPVLADGRLGKGETFINLTDERGEDAIDGVKVDTAGNVYISGPGGLWIVSPDGEHLGTIVTPRHAHNFAWGDADGQTLYLCARGALYRMRLNVAGVRP